MKKVITYGTFDLFHEGHYRLLERAKALGDYLIVGVTTESYDKTRGKLGVVDSLMTRIENVKKTGFADEVIIEEAAGQKFSDIKKYGIDIFTVGSDWTGCFDYLNEFCQVVYLERTQNISSTMLREKKRHIQRIGVIGTGRIANRFMPEAKLVSGVNMQGVYNPHAESADRFAKRWDIAAYHDLESFFANVDIVYVASPHETHFYYTMAALQHGKHVLCEKPMAMSRGEAERAFDYARERGLILMEAIKTAYCPGFQHLLGIANSGKIGKIKYIDACFTKLENPKHRELVDLEYGGSFLELGSYGMLPIMKLMGIDYEDVYFESIKGGNGLDIFTRATFKYAGGFASAVCGLGVKAEGRLLISGTNGYIVVEAPWWKTSYFEVHYENPDEVEKYADMFLSYGLRYEISDMLMMMDAETEEQKGSFKLTRNESIAMAGVFEKFRSQK